MTLGSILLTFFGAPVLLGVASGFFGATENWMRQFKIGGALVGVGQVLFVLMVKGVGTLDTAVLFAGPLLAIGCFLLGRAVVLVSRANRAAPSESPSN